MVRDSPTVTIPLLLSSNRPEAGRASASSAWGWGPQAQQKMPALSPDQLNASLYPRSSPRQERDATPIVIISAKRHAIP